MKVLIVGCNQLGTELSSRLSTHGHEVVVIDRDKSSFINLPHAFKGRVHEGDPLNRDVLLRAGIEEADALVAITESDVKNYVIGMVAREIFNIPLVLVRSFDPACQEVCNLMGLQAISSAIWGAERLEEMLCHSDVDSVFSIGGGEVGVYAITIPEEWNGQALNRLINEDPHQNPIVITRSGKAMLASNQIVVKKDDILHIAADHEGIENLRGLLARTLKEGKRCT